MTTQSVLIHFIGITLALETVVVVFCSIVAAMEYWHSVRRLDHEAQEIFRRKWMRSVIPSALGALALGSALTLLYELVLFLKG